MAWRHTKTVDEVLILEGPAGDTVALEIQNDDPADGVLWTGWTWSGQVRSADGTTLIGTFSCSDAGTTNTALTLSATLGLGSGQSLVPGTEYIGGIKGTKSGKSTTWVEMKLYPELSAVQ